MLGRSWSNVPARMPIALSSRRLALLVFTAIAVVTRAAPFGNPIQHVDDQFYLLVGKAIVHDQLPYVDIWDRKPIGLFLIYAAIACLGGTGVEQYQFVAGLVAVATAMIIRELGSRLAGDRGGLLAGACYLVVVVSLGGQGGQSPIFYNPLIAGAGLLFFEAARPGGKVGAPALAAMLLCGLALTIKQVSVVEGVFIGAAFLLLAFRRGRATRQIVLLGLAMLAVAILPTAAAAGFYAARGELIAFIFANFVSIFLKESLGWHSRVAGALFACIFLFPLIIVGAMGVVARYRSGGRSAEAEFVAGWIAASAVGVVAIPNFFEHYNLPLVVPLCVSAATMLARGRGPALATAIGILAWSQGSMFQFADNRRGRAAFERLASDVVRYRHGGCLYVSNGPPLLYDYGGGCRLTKYQFGDHLMEGVEANAVGIDQQTEIARILTLRPAVIIRRTDAERNENPVSGATLASGLTRNYRRVDALSAPVEGRIEWFEVWQRSDLP